MSLFLNVLLSLILFSVSANISENKYGPIAAAVQTDDNLLAYFKNLNGGRIQPTPDDYDMLLRYFNVLNTEAFWTHNSVYDLPTNRTRNIVARDVLGRTYVLFAASAIMNPESVQTTTNYADNFLKYCYSIPYSDERSMCLEIYYLVSHIKTSLGPSGSMQLRDVAVVLGDHWTKDFVFNGVEYEGALMPVIIQHVTSSIKSMKVAEKDRSSVKDLINQLERCSRIKSLYSLGKTLNSLKLLAKSILMCLNLQSEGESILLPFGWADMNNSMDHATPEKGHAMLLEFVRTKANTVTFHVYNQGDGLQYHPTKMDGEVKLSSPIISYDDVSIQDLINYSFIEGVISVVNPVPISPTDNAGAEAIYLDLLRPFLNQLREITTVYVKEQKGGTCSIAAITAYLLMKLSERLFRDIRLVVDIAAWEKGYALSVDDMTRPVKYEILDRGLQTIARRLYRYSKRGDPLSKEVNRLYEMHQRLKGLKQNIVPQIRLLKIKRTDLNDMDGELQEFVNSQREKLKTDEEYQHQSMGFQLPNFNNGQASFINTCFDLSQSLDPLIAYDPEYKLATITNAINEEIPDPYSDYYSDLDRTSAFVELQNYQQLLMFYAELLRFKKAVNHSELTALTKMYLVSWALALRSHPEILEGHAPSVAFIERALKQPSMVPTSLSSGERMANLLNWRSSLKGEELFDYSSWPTYENVLLFDPEHFKTLPKNAEISLMPKLHKYILKHENKQTFDSSVRDHVAKHCQENLSKIDDHIVLGYIWAVGTESVQPFTLMRNIALQVLTCTKDVSQASFWQGFPAWYMKDSKVSYNVGLVLTIHGLNQDHSQLDDQYMFFKDDGRKESGRDQNTAIARSKERANSLDCVLNSDNMRIANAMSYYRDNPDILFTKRGIEVLAQSVANPKYTSRYLAKNDTSEALFKFLNELRVNCGNKLDFEGLIDNQDRPAEFEAFIILVWAESKILNEMSTSMDVLRAAASRLEQLRQTISKYLLAGKGRSRGFISQPRTKAILSSLMALTYPTGSLYEMDAYTMFLKYTIQAKDQGGSEEFSIIRWDLWNKLMITGRVIGPHLMNISHQFAKEIIPDFEFSQLKFNEPVLELSSKKDSVRTETVVRINLLSCFKTINGNPTTISLDDMFSSFNFDYKSLDFETSLKGTELMAVSKNNRKMIFRNRTVYLISDEGSICEALPSENIKQLNSLSLFGPVFENDKNFDIWACPESSSEAIILTGKQLETTLAINSDLTINLMRDNLRHATLLNQIKAFGNLDSEKGTCVYVDDKFKFVNMEFIRYIDENGDRIVLKVDRSDLDSIIYDEEHVVSHNQTTAYGNTFGRYLILEKDKSATKNHSNTRKAIIPFFQSDHRRHDPEVGRTVHRCYMMNLKDDGSIEPATRIQTLVLSHQLLWARFYDESFRLLQIIDMSTKFTDDEVVVLGSMMAYCDSSPDYRPEALAIGIHSLSLFFKMSVDFDGEKSESPAKKLFVEAAMPQAQKKYTSFDLMVQNKLRQYYENQNNVPNEMRIHNVEYSLTGLNLIDMKLMRQKYESQLFHDVGVPGRSLLNITPTTVPPSLNGIDLIGSSEATSQIRMFSQYSLFRPDCESFQKILFVSMNNRSIRVNDYRTLSAIYRLSRSRKDESVQGMRRIMSSVPRASWIDDFSNGKIDLKGAETTKIALPHRRDLSFGPEKHDLPNSADTKISFKLEEMEKIISLPKGNTESPQLGTSPRFEFQDVCGDDGYCKRRYEWFSHELRKGRMHYLEKSKKAEAVYTDMAEALKNSNVFSSLSKKLEKYCESESKNQTTLWNQVKQFSVTILQSSTKGEAYFMKIGKISIKPTLRNLTNAFIRESIDGYLKIYPGASEDALVQLHSLIAEFYAAKTRHQHYVRALSLLKKIGKYSVESQLSSSNFEKKTALIRLLDEELSVKSKRAYRIEEFPVFAVFEAFADVRLRHDQVKLLQSLLENKVSGNYISQIVQLMMSGGKTFVLGTLLAFCKADGYHLSTIVVPQSLFETNYMDMKTRSWKYFRQPCYPFIFDRGVSSTEENIKVLLRKLVSIIKNRGYIITTPQSLQNLTNSFTELVNNASPSIKNHSLFRSFLPMQQILKIFQSRGAATFDEIDLNFVPTKELNYPTSAKEGIDEVVLQTITDIFYLTVTDDELKDKLGISQNRQALFDQERHSEIIRRVSKLLYSKFSKNDGSYGIPQDLSEKDFIEFFVAKTHKEPPFWIKNAYMSSKNATKTEQFKRILELHHVLHSNFLQSLTRTVNFHFGPSMKFPEILIAKPFVAANTPSETSDFASKWETVCKTFLTFLHNGLGTEHVLIRTAMFMKFLQAHAKKELLDGDAYDLRNTKSFEYFRKATGEDLFFASPSDEHTILDLNRKANDKSPESMKFMLKFVQQRVLLGLAVNTEQIFSYPLNVPSLFKSVQGYSGTMDELFTFPHRIIFPGSQSLEKGKVLSNEIIFDEGSSGWVLTNLIEEDNHIIQIDKSDEDIKIEDIMDKAREISPNHRVMIDLGAIFKGTSNFKVAQALSAYFHKNNDQKIGAILYFDNFSDRLNFITVGENEPKEIAGTTSQMIKSSTKLPHSKIFTYLDNNHYTGVDILQVFNSRAILTTNTEFTARDLVQAIMRMRGFLKKQRVDFILTKTVKEHMESKQFKLSFAGIISMSIRNSILLEQRYYEKAGFQKLIDFYRQFILKKIVSEEDLAHGEQLYKKFSDLFKRTSDNNIFGMIFGEFENRLVTDVLEVFNEAVLLRMKAYVSETEFEEITEGSHEIISHAAKFISGKIPFSKDQQVHFDSESTVEVSNQVEVEQQIEQNTNHRWITETFKEKPWNSLTKRQFKFTDDWSTTGDAKVLSLSSVLSKNDDFAEYSSLFDNRIGATSNYLCLEPDKITLFDVDQKKVHSLLLLTDRADDKTVIDSLIILSNRDADEIAQLISIARADSAEFHIIDLNGDVVEGDPLDTHLLEELKILLMDVFFFSCNVSAVLTRSEVLKNWTAKAPELKMRFLKKVVKEVVGPEKYQLLTDSSMFTLLSELSKEDIAVSSEDIFSLRLEPSKMPSIKSSIVESVQVYGVQCPHFFDYLDLLRRLSEIEESRKGHIYRSICDIILPDLCDCATDDSKVEAILKSISYIEETDRVAVALLKLTSQKKEYQLLMDQIAIKAIAEDAAFIINQSKHLPLLYHYADVFGRDMEIMENLISSFHRKENFALLGFIIKSIYRKTDNIPKDIERMLGDYLENVLNKDPYRFFRVLVDSSTGKPPKVLADKLDLLKEKFVSQELEIFALYNSFVGLDKSQDLEDIFSFEERKKLLEDIYYSGKPLTEINRSGSLSTLIYVYREDQSQISKAVIEMGKHSVAAFTECITSMSFDDVELLEGLTELAASQKDIRDVLDDSNESELSELLKIHFRNDIAVKPTVLKSMLELKIMLPREDIIDYLARNFVVDGDLMKYLDGFLAEDPILMKRYVKGCIHVGSLEFLKLESFKSQHIRDDKFDIDFFLQSDADEQEKSSTLKNKIELGDL